MNLAQRLIKTAIYLIIPSLGLAQDHLILPNSFLVHETAIGFTRNYELVSKEKKFAYLKKFQQPNRHYTLLSTDEHLLTEITSHVLSQTTYFDIYDDNKQKLGMVEEYFHTSFPSFNIYLGDSKFPAINAKMNFWGTTFTIKDGLTHQEIAQMSRPYLHLKNEWSITIKEPILLDKKHIDPKLFLSVVAIQCDEENWHVIPKTKKLDLSDIQIHQTIKTLDQEFNRYRPSDEGDDDFFCHQYQKFCEDKIQAPSLDASQQQHVKLLLMNRLATLKALSVCQYQ